MILFAKSMSILNPPGGGGDSGLSFPHPFSGLQSKPAEGVQVSGTEPSISAARASAAKANPVARIVALASFMVVSITQVQTSVVSFRSFRLGEPQEISTEAAVGSAATRRSPAHAD